jgi:hypothetical protein
MRRPRACMGGARSAQVHMHGWRSQRTLGQVVLLQAIEHHVRPLAQHLAAPLSLTQAAPLRRQHVQRHLQIVEAAELQPSLHAHTRDSHAPTGSCGGAAHAWCTCMHTVTPLCSDTLRSDESPPQST